MALNHALTHTLLIAGLLILPACGWAESAPSIALNEESGDVKNLVGAVTIDAPAESVWQTITDYEGMKDFMPGYQKSQVLSSSGPSKRVDVAVKVLKCLPAFKYQVNIRENRSAMNLDITRVAGDFKSIHAVYRLTPINGGTQTVLNYTLQINVGSSVPNFGLNGILKSNAKSSLSAIQTQCTSNYRKTMVARR